MGSDTFISNSIPLCSFVFARLVFLRLSPPFAPASPSAGSPAFSGDAFNSPPHQRSSENRGGETDVGVDEGRVEKKKKQAGEQKDESGERLAR